MIFCVTLDDKDFSITNENRMRNLKKWIYAYLNKEDDGFDPKKGEKMRTTRKMMLEILQAKHPDIDEVLEYLDLFTKDDEINFISEEDLLADFYEFLEK